MNIGWAKEGYDSYIYYFNGIIDDVRIYNRALSRSEIQELFQFTGLSPHVDINIKPGSDPNSINTCSGGSTPVTIWGSDALDVNTIDPAQLILSSATAKTVGKSDRILCSTEDVGAPNDTAFDNLDPNPDGYLDLTCHFITIELTDLDDTSSTADLRITGCDSGSACQTGDSGYYEVSAEDSVNIVKDCN